MDIQTLIHDVGDFAATIGGDVKKHRESTKFCEFVLNRIAGEAEMQSLREEWDSRCKDADYLGIEPEEVGTFDGLRKVMAALEGSPVAQTFVDNALGSLMQPLDNGFKTLREYIETTKAFDNDRT